MANSQIISPYEFFANDRPDIREWIDELGKEAMKKLGMVERKIRSSNTSMKG